MQLSRLRSGSSGSFSVSGSGRLSWGSLRIVTGVRRVQSWPTDPGRSPHLLVPALTHSRKLYDPSRGTVPSPRTASSTSFSTHTRTPRSPLPAAGSPSNFLTKKAPAAICPTTAAFLRLSTRTVISLSSTTQIRRFSQQKPTTANTSTTTPLPIMYEGKWTAPTVRKTFLEYFEQRGHTIGANQSCHPKRKLRSQFKIETQLNRTNNIELILQCPPPPSYLTMTPHSCSPMLA